MCTFGHYAGVGEKAILEMNDQFQQYKGTYPYKTDSKNRVNVTAGWRPKAGENLYMMPSFDRKSELPIIKVLTDEGISARLQIIDENEPDIGERSEMKSALKRNIRDASLNDQGKLLLIKALADHAGIEVESDVFLVAGDSHFEIWSAKNHAIVHGGLGIPATKNKFNVF